jgi:hypothetical protein
VAVIATLSAALRALGPRLLILGRDGVAATAAAGLLLTVTGTVGALAWLPGPARTRCGTEAAGPGGDEPRARSER